VDVLAATADVLHVHMDYRGLFQRLRVAPTDRQRVAITYHGSLPPGDPRVTYRDEGTDSKLGALVFGARPYHHRHGVEHWLPIPMPVANYKALRASVTRYPLPWEGGRLRIAHSPTKREIKGTEAFLSAVGYLKDYGLPVEPVLIEDMSHGEALALKATCHVVFDSFWLGMQGSGLEGAAMGLPVIAGDSDAVADLAGLGIPCPWAFADGRGALRDIISRLCVDSGYYASKAQRVHDYTVAHHDYPVVGAKYATILRETVRGAAH
jgi:glycosyltransferase involved in cell wall biosynthesis